MSKKPPPNISGSPKVIQGKNGWLFLNNDTNKTWDQYTGDLLLSEKACQEWSSEFSRRLEFFYNLGIHYRFVVIPNKESILPEKIADKFQKNDHRIVHQIFDLSKDKIHSIILEDFFLNHPRRLELYDKEDTHYNFWVSTRRAGYPGRV